MLQHRVLEGSHGGQVAIGFRRRLSDRFASLGQAVATPALSRPTDGNVDVLLVARGDPVRNAYLTQKSGSKALTLKWTLRSNDWNTSMYCLPCCRVAGEAGAIQVDIHRIEEARELITRQPGEHPQVAVWIEPCCPKGSREPLMEPRPGPREPVRRGDPELTAPDRLRNARQDDIVGRIKFDRLMTQGKADYVGARRRSLPGLRVYRGQLGANTGSR